MTNYSFFLFSSCLTKGILEFFRFFFSVYCIQHCFICRPADFLVSEDAEIEARTVATSALAVRRSNHLARSNPQAWLDLIHKLVLQECTRKYSIRNAQVHSFSTRYNAQK
jgi:hypothetical protein